MSSAWPRVLVVILNWNGADATLACLRSLEAADYPTFDVLVIDNGSRRSVGPAVRASFPAVDCIELPVNLGYAGGNNVGLRRALEMPYDFAYVLNNDALVDPWAIRAAVEAACATRIAAIGGKVLAFEDPERLWMTYGTIDYRQSLVRLAGWGERNRPAGTSELFEAYDLGVDPGELRNLFTDQSDRFAPLAERLRGYAKSGATERPSAGGAVVPPPDAATAEKLRALGYVK